MKKNLLIMAAIASATLVSCSNEEFTGEEASISAESNAIVFKSNTSALTRADLIGADAAAKLGNAFVVYGTKHAAAEDGTAANDEVVFDNFLVEWGQGTAGTTESNSSDWEYVGKAAYSSAVSAQGIKYWDYSAAEGYTFYAFSSTDISYPASPNDAVSVTKVTTDGNANTPSLYNKGYKVTVNSSAKLENLFFSDRAPVAKANYGQPVSLTFRNFGAKVRVGFYETIPGYSVKIDKFYIDADGPTAPVTDFAAMNDAQTVFAASLQNVKRSEAQTLNVTYFDNQTTLENRPKVTQPTAGYDYSLKLGNGTGIINKVLGTTSSAPTWVAGLTANNYYIPVFPFEANESPMLIKLDFTLTSTDGTNEEIHVKGARAIVPAEYVKWKSNFAYTYIFKISDKSNGTTGEVDGNGDPTTDPESLIPITFDAVVVDIAGEVQETITSVSTNSITTYAEGVIADEYKANSPIYVAVTNNATNAVITPTANNAQVYQLSKAASEAEVFAQLTGSPMGITMTAVTSTIETTVPLADGTTAAIDNVKFTPAAAGYYAYVYTTTAYVAPTYAALTDNDNYDSSMTYYLQSQSGAYYPVTVKSEAAFTANKTKLFKQTAAGTAGVYDIKVIKVQ